MEKSRRSSFSFRSRSVLRLASCLLVASSATGCVASKHYDEARSVAESEAQAHSRTRERLEASLARIRALETELAENQRRMALGSNAAEESKLASVVATKEKEAAVELVEQLRSELARTGDHLMLFAREKRDLAQTLLVAEQRMGDIELASKHLGELVAVTRDLSLELENELEKGSVELSARDGQVVVSVKSERLFATGGDMLVTEAGPVLAALGKVSGEHQGMRVIVREATPASSRARVQRLGDALRERGVADSRLVLAAGPTAELTPAPDVATAPASGATDTPSACNSATERDAPLPAAAPSPAPARPRYEIAFAP